MNLRGCRGSGAKCRLCPGAPSDPSLSFPTWAVGHKNSLTSEGAQSGAGPRTRWGRPDGGGRTSLGGGGTSAWTPTQPLHLCSRPPMAPWPLGSALLWEGHCFKTGCTYFCVAWNTLPPASGFLNPAHPWDPGQGSVPLPLPEAWHPRTCPKFQFLSHTVIQKSASQPL